jgi:hypothetical protein
MTNVAMVRTGLSGVCQSMTADGYDMSITALRGTTLHIKVDAGPDACAECLVPKPVLAGIVMQTLNGQFGVSEVALTYPTEVGTTS